MKSTPSVNPNRDRLKQMAKDTAKQLGKKWAKQFGKKIVNTLAGNPITWIVVAILVIIIVIIIPLIAAMVFLNSDTGKEEIFISKDILPPVLSAAPIDQQLIHAFGDTVGGQTNQGIDIKGTRGQPVFSLSQSKVVSIHFPTSTDPASLQKKGKTITLQAKVSNEPVTITYGHLNRIFVVPGQSLQAGSLIGTLGHSGLPKGQNELHLDFIQRKKPVDPMIYLNNISEASAFVFSQVQTYSPMIKYPDFRYTGIEDYQFKPFLRLSQITVGGLPRPVNGWSYAYLRPGQHAANNLITFKYSADIIYGNYAFLVEAGYDPVAKKAVPVFYSIRDPYFHDLIINSVDFHQLHIPAGNRIEPHIHDRHIPDVLEITITNSDHPQMVALDYQGG